MTEQQTDCGPTMGPAPEHARLEEAVGTWKVDCTFYMDPSQPSMKNQATEKVELLGELWATSRFTCDMMGMPFEGRATIGYEPTTGKWGSSWVDVMTPYLFKFDLAAPGRPERGAAARREAPPAEAPQATGRTTYPLLRPGLHDPDVSPLRTART